MPVVGWNQPHPVCCVLSVMSFQWSFCSLTQKIVSFWLGRQPYHLFRPVFSEPWTRDPLTPPTFNFTAPKGVWCQLLGAGTDSVDKPQAGYGHQTLPRWDAGFSSIVGQVILARSCPSVGGGVLAGSCGTLGAEMPVAFTERMAVTTCEMERDSLRRGDAGTVLGGELGKQE